MATYSAEGCTLLIASSEIGELKSFTLPEETAEVLKHANLKSTKMAVDVSKIKDLGQFSIAYRFDPADVGQTAVRSGVGDNVSKVFTLSIVGADDIVITGKISQVGGGSSDGIAKVEETATIEVEDIA